MLFDFVFIIFLFYGIQEEKSQVVTKTKIVGLDILKRLRSDDVDHKTEPLQPYIGNNIVR